MFDEMLSGFRDKFQKRVTCVAFQSTLQKQIRKLPKILKSVKTIQYYSTLFTRVLTPGKVEAAERGQRRAGRAGLRVRPRRVAQRARRGRLHDLPRLQRVT